MVRIAAGIAAGLITSVQMGLLGALITFAPRSLYAPHIFTTGVWHLTPLEDQQLGGTIMWIPGCIVFFAAAAFMLGRAFQPSSQSCNTTSDSVFCL
jgi:putative membrane protein